MPASTAIGVAQKDGSVLATRAHDGSSDIAAMLDGHYADALKATMLVSLGTLHGIGPTPRQCLRDPTGAEPDLVDQVAFERLCGMTGRFHLFEHGAWTHWSSETVAGALFRFAE